MSAFFRDLANALRPEYEKIEDRILHQQPVYRVHNLDANNRHLNPRHGLPMDIDFCSDCGDYTDIVYWFGGLSVSKSGQIVEEKQTPLCRRCQRETFD